MPLARTRNTKLGFDFGQAEALNHTAMNDAPKPTESDKLDSLEATPARPGRWLAIETSGMHGSIAAAEVAAEGCEVVASESLRRDARSAQTLAPAIHALLKRLGWAPADLATIAVAAGPGSFTGLRVGVVTAKTLAYALRTPILGVDTLDALAEGNAPEEGDTGLWTILDAQRGELFAARFAPVGGRWVRDEPTQRLTRDALLDYLKPSDRVIGPNAIRLAGEEISSHSFEDTEPQAEAVLHVAWGKWKEGAADNVFAMAPQYLRQSAAEEKLEP